MLTHRDNTTCTLVTVSKRTKQLSVAKWSVTLSVEGKARTVVRAKAEANSNLLVTAKRTVHDSTVVEVGSVQDSIVRIHLEFVTHDNEVLHHTALCIQLVDNRVPITDVPCVVGVCVTRTGKLLKTLGLAWLTV